MALPGWTHQGRKPCGRSVWSCSGLRPPPPDEEGSDGPPYWYTQTHTHTLIIHMCTLITSVRSFAHLQLSLARYINTHIMFH